MGVIRLLLAISVLITHASPLFGMRMLNGDMAVICFFIVSGFLMAMILETKYAGRVQQFAVNRLLRIYPPYFAALLFAGVVFFIIPNSHHNPYKSLGVLLRTGDYELFWGAVVSNLTLFGADLSRYVNFTKAGEIIFPNFMHRGEGSGAHNLLFVPQAWTLPLELMFYFLAPLVVKLHTRRLAFLLSFVAFVYWLAWQIARYMNIPFEPSAFFPLQLLYFLMGSLAYRAMLGLEQAINADKFYCRYVPAVSLVVGLLIVFVGYDSVRALRVADQYLYIIFALCVPGIFLFSRDSARDSAIGEYSYPVYLFHYPIAKSADLIVPSVMEGWFTLALTLVVSAIYIYSIDRKISTIRRVVAAR